MINTDDFVNDFTYISPPNNPFVYITDRPELTWIDPTYPYDIRNNRIKQLTSGLDPSIIYEVDEDNRFIVDDNNYFIEALV